MRAMQQKQVGILFTSILLSAMCVFGVQADTVLCKDGRVFEGEVLKETLNTIRIRTAQGTYTLPRSEIKNVEYKESPFQIVKKRREALSSEDAEGRWKLVEYCRANGVRKEAEELCRELRAVASPFYVRASRSLGEMIGKHNANEAVKILDDLVEKTGDAEAKVLSKTIKQGLDEKRKRAYEEALEAHRNGQLDKAIDGLRHAYQLSYPGLTKGGVGAKGAGGVVVTEANVLEKLIGIRKAMDEKANARKKGAARNQSEHSSTSKPTNFNCSHCPKHSGWDTCGACKGAGKITKQSPPTFSQNGMRPGRKYQVVCASCQGAKMTRCVHCAGSSLDVVKLASRLRWGVKSLADLAWGDRSRDPMEAMKRVEKKAAYGKMTFPESLKPAYAVSKNLRALLPSVPVDRAFSKSADYKKLTALWAKASKNAKANFLCCYAVESAQNAMPSAVGAGVEGGGVSTSALDSPDIKKLKTQAESASASVISAFPEDWAGKWVSVEGAYRGTDSNWSGKDRHALQFETGKIHNLHPYCFIPATRKPHRIAANEPNAAPFLKAIAEQYPYDQMYEKIGALTEGDKVRLIGRFVYRKDHLPESSLEIWGIESFLDEKMQQNLALVRKPVTFSFQDTPLGEAAYFLSLVTNTKIRLGSKDWANLNVSGKANKESLAFALSRLIKKARLVWVFDDKKAGLKIAEKPAPSEVKTRDAVLQYLK